ncbi:hypothetical protein [Streptomyces melanogenes]|uniref:hypothetical protein n=1 Tax=Streptomyces melanogenes TaxID=67326 RepID=UPI00167EE34A|nr:hypothetical protein [Streptomyces melanogenes]GGP85653.1 hypothetical protein GCM10010278_75070 [Streptomyces melanogenes]
MTSQRPDLADELLRRSAADQHARGVRAHGNVAPDLEAMRTVDAENTPALKRAVRAPAGRGNRIDPFPPTPTPR